MAYEIKRLRPTKASKDWLITYVDTSYGPRYSVKIGTDNRIRLNSIFLEIRRVV